MLGEESAYQHDSVFAFDAYDGPAAVPWPWSVGQEGGYHYNALSLGHWHATARDSCRALTHCCRPLSARSLSGIPDHRVRKLRRKGRTAMAQHAVSAHLQPCIARLDSDDVRIIVGAPGARGTPRCRCPTLQRRREALVCRCSNDPDREVTDEFRPETMSLFDL